MDIQSVSDAEIVTIHPNTEVLTCQKLPYFVGVSAQTTGSRGLSMQLVVIPPGASAIPHFHAHFETAIYILEGEVETRYGINLEKSIINRTGDFIFIPPGVPHTPTNLSKTEPARALVARNDPSDQENVVLYDIAGVTPVTESPS